MKQRSEKGIIVLLITSLIITLILSALLTEVSSKISKDYIEFIIGLSITMAGFGLVAFQVAKASDELKKDFIESSIFMIISALFGIFYWIDGEIKILAIVSSFFFLWGLVLLLLILIDKRFDLIK
jgi:ABC-type uncharacterized transport system permease subunit